MPDDTVTPIIPSTTPDPATEGQLKALQAERELRQKAVAKAAELEAKLTETTTQAEQWRSGADAWTAHLQTQVDTGLASLPEPTRKHLQGLGLPLTQLAETVKHLQALTPAPPAQPAAPAAPPAPPIYPAGGGSAPGGTGASSLTPDEQAFKASRPILANASDDSVKAARRALHPQG